MFFQAFLVLLHGVTFLASAATIRAPAKHNVRSNSLHLVPSIAEQASTVFPANPGPHNSLLDISLTDDEDEPQCLDVLGTNLNVASCRNAVSKIPRSTQYITLGWRGRGRFDLTLPYIYMSDDAACAIYVVPKPTFRPDVFTFTGISENAQRVLQRCVADPRIDSGGFIANLGRSRQINVQINRVDVNVECDDLPAPSYSSCRNVLDIMQWDQTIRHFGPGGEYPLPFLIPSSDGQCVFQLTANGVAPPPRSTSWYRIFTVIAAIDEKCVKNGRSGHGYTDGTVQGLKISIAQRREVAVS